MNFVSPFLVRNYGRDDAVNTTPTALSRRRPASKLHFVAGLLLCSSLVRPGVMARSRRTLPLGMDKQMFPVCGGGRVVDISTEDHFLSIFGSATAFR